MILFIDMIILDLFIKANETNLFIDELKIHHEEIRYILLFAIPAWGSNTFLLFVWEKDLSNQERGRKEVTNLYNLSQERSKDRLVNNKPPDFINQDYIAIEASFVPLWEGLKVCTLGIVFLSFTHFLVLFDLLFDML